MSSWQYSRKFNKNDRIATIFYLRVFFDKENIGLPKICTIIGQFRSQFTPTPRTNGDIITSFARTFLSNSRGQEKPLEELLIISDLRPGFK